jgi:hypothetical protein
VRLNNKKPVLVIKQSDLATFKKKRVNQLGLVMILHEPQAFTTNFYSKYEIYRPNSRLKKLECSVCHSYEFLCVMVELYYTGRVKTRRNITRYFFSYLKFTPLFWLWVKFTPLFRLWVKFTPLYFTPLQIDPQWSICSNTYRRLKCSFKTSFLE